MGLNTLAGSRRDSGNVHGSSSRGNLLNIGHGPTGGQGYNIYHKQELKKEDSGRPPSNFMGPGHGKGKTVHPQNNFRGNDSKKVFNYSDFENSVGGTSDDY